MSVLRSYFDGGNQADSREYDVFSLAVMSGTHDLWKPFERDWQRVLKKYSAQHLHTTYAVSRTGIYRGWTENQRDKFLLDCVRVAAKHCARASIDNAPGKYGLRYFVVSFVLKDFVEFSKAHPESPQNVSDGCLRQAMADTLLWCKNQAACTDCHCFFDQGEPFFGILSQIMQSKKAMKDSWLLNLISYRGVADMRHLPALQLADLYAWCQSRRNSVWQPNWQTKLLKTHFGWQWIDKSNIRDVDSGYQKAVRSWKLPRLAATK